MLIKIFSLLWKNFEPTKSIIIEIFHFCEQQQVLSESIEEYNAAPCKLATNAIWGMSGGNSADCFIRGLYIDAIYAQASSGRD